MTFLADLVLSWDGTTARATDPRTNTDFVAPGSEFGAVFNAAMAALTGGGNILIDAKPAAGTAAVIPFKTTLVGVSNLRIQGGGPGVVLQATAPFVAGANGAIGLDLFAATNCRVEDVTIDGNGQITSGILIVGASGTTHVIFGCVITGWTTGYGISIGKSTDAFGTGSGATWVSHCRVGPAASPTTNASGSLSECSAVTAMCSSTTFSRVGTTALSSRAQRLTSGPATT